LIDMGASEGKPQNHRGCLPPQMGKTFTAAEMQELRDMYELVVQYRAGDISPEQLAEYFPGVLEDGGVEGEAYNKQIFDDFVSDLTYEDFVITVHSHFSDATAGAFVAETLSSERKVEIDANDIDLVSIFKYYDDDDNGTVDLEETRNALRELYRVSQRSFENYPSWDDESLSDALITEHIKKIQSEADAELADMGEEVIEMVKKEIRLDFAEFSTLANEFVRFATLSMIELKHRERRGEWTPEESQ